MKTIIIGLDAFDPKKFEALHDQGKMPHLGEYLSKGGYSPFSISNPAQSEVSWTSIATGLNPGGHGLFDFVHRNPRNYGINVSLLPTKQSLVGLQFAPPHEAQTIFEYAVDHGYPATSLWWPATFPARLTSPVHTIPGLGTPDIAGKIGVGLLFTAEDLGSDAPQKTEIGKLESTGNASHYEGEIKGPQKAKKGKMETIVLPFELSFSDPQHASLNFGRNQSFNLEVGQWSPIIELTFKMGFGIKLKAVTKAIITKGKENPWLYFLPLQIHPLSSAWPYATPRNFVRKTWNDQGPFLTLGWPQDTTGLDEGIISDQQFLELCDSIITTREKVFTAQLQNFNEGVLSIVFDTLDRVQHMFWRDYPDVIENWYLKLDSLIGRLSEQIKVANHQDSRILILSDHGFANYDYKLNLNRWLIDQNFLSLKSETAEPSLDSVDWSKSQAYAIGLNSIYLNQQGREGQGIVSEGNRDDTLQKIKEALLKLEGPDGKNVVTSVATNQEAFEGALSYLGPDLLVGYTPGYRASADTGLGRWSEELIIKNTDHWNADHCINSTSVPGVIFSNQSLSNFPNPSYKDIPPLAVGATMKEAKLPKEEDFTEEDRETVEDRLKGLGYL